MQTNPESAAVEAVAWRYRLNEKGNGPWGSGPWGYETRKPTLTPSGFYDLEPLVPQSALDALRGEVERRKSAQAALSQYASAAEQRADAAERRLAEVREIQRSNYGNGVGLHLEMILWAREYDALTKESP